MGLVQQVSNGELVSSASQTSLSKSTSTSNSTADQDTFLQLLVAEVQNQDPLEPTSNTEWVSQYATFSELEAMTNMSASYDLSRASSLVGEQVIMNVDDQTIEGRVDYVTYEAGEAYLSIGGSLYSLDDLSQVIDEEYKEASEAIATWQEAMDALPSLDKLTASDEEDVANVYLTYNNFSDYTKSLVSSSYSDLLDTYVSQMIALVGTDDD